MQLSMFEIHHPVYSGDYARSPSIPSKDRSALDDGQGRGGNRKSVQSGNQLRDEGIKRTKSKNGPWIAEAQSLALRLAVENGEVSADDLYPHLACKRMLPVPSTGCMGAVFRHPRLLFLRYEPSKRPERHGNRNGFYGWVSA